MFSSAEHAAICPVYSLILDVMREKNILNKCSDPDPSGSLDKIHGQIYDPSGSVDKIHAWISDPSGSLDKMLGSDL